MTPRLHRSRKLVLIATTLFLGTALATNSTTHAKEASKHVPEIKWDTKIKKFRFDNDKFLGQRLTVRCPPANINQTIPKVFGTGTYPSDTPICAAALHAGVITKEGGTVTIQLNPGKSEYKGSTQNGVTSADRPETKRSIVFVTEANAKAADKQRLAHLPRIDWNTKFTRTGFAYRDLIGQQISFRCPPAPGNLKSRLVYGTDDYAFASMICRAAAHAGKLSLEAGGVVTVQINPGVEELVGSIRNGIETSSKQGSDRSIRFVDNVAAKK